MLLCLIHISNGIGSSLGYWVDPPMLDQTSVSIQTIEVLRNPHASKWKSVDHPLVHCELA